MEEAAGDVRPRVRVPEGVTELGGKGGRRVMGWEELRSRLVRCGLGRWVAGVEEGEAAREAEKEAAEVKAVPEGVQVRWRGAHV